MGDLSCDLSLEVVATHLQSSLRFMGYEQDEEAKQLMAKWEMFLFPKSRHNRSYSYAEFVMLSIDASHFVFDFFGLFDFLNDFANGRLDGRPPQKEGFLRKSFSNMAVKVHYLLLLLILLLLLFLCSSS
jgi:hypothetical protein